MRCIATIILVLGIVPAAAIAAPAISDGLIVYYDFERIAGTQDPPTIDDRSPNGYDGTIGGTSRLSISPNGVFANCGYFEGPTEAYVDLPTLPHDVIPTDAVTIAAWVKHAPMTDNMEIFMPMSADPSKQLMHCELRTGDMARFLIRTPIDPAMDIVSMNNVGSVPADTWVHYAATYDRNLGMAYLYIDGEIVAEAAGTRDMYNEWDQGARVGWTVDGARPYIGLMDEFAIWNRALSQDDVKKLMAGPVLPTQITDGLIVHYAFEEISDAQDPPMIEDQSQNDFDGTIGGTSVLSISTDGVFGNCGFFEGPTEAYIDLPTLPHQAIPIDAITIAVWVNHATMSTDAMEIFMPMSLDPSKQLIHTELRPGDMARFLIRTPIDPAINIIDINNVGSVPANQWVHYAATYDRNLGMAYLYIDGEIVAEYEGTREMYNEWDQGARVGLCVDGPRPFIGYMDEFAIWGRALSQDEILQVMDEGIQPEPTLPIFIRGDTDGNGSFTIGDGVQVLERLFANREAFTSNCDKTGDLDNSENLTIGDAVWLFNYLFADGEPPVAPPPVGQCGKDADTTLGCLEHSPACVP
ncbi:MAG: LamG domain-containing protein [Planctomycetes bacterium]|nr:LamG domain-containing protein [Planctomycetota bacterium]